MGQPSISMTSFLARLSKKSEPCVYLGCNLLNSLDLVSEKAPQKEFFDSLNRLMYAEAPAFGFLELRM